MTIRALRAQAKHIRLLRGEECVRANVGYNAALLLDFGELHPPDQHGYRQPEMGVVAECPWRLDGSAEVIVGSGDDDERILSRIQICVGQRVVRVTVFRPSYMVRIALTGDLYVWIFPDDSSDYVAESEYPRSPWYVAGRALPGGWEE